VVAAPPKLGLVAGNLDATQLNLRPQTTSGLDELLTGFVGQLRAAQTVLYLALAGLFAVAFGVLALACRLLTERLRTPLATMRARGASRAQLSLGVGLTALLVALPTAAAGYGLAAALTPGTAALPGVLAVLAGTVLLPAMLAAWDHRRSGRTERSDLAQRRAGPRQIVFELLAVALAIAGVGALRSRGLTTESAERGADPFLVMVPVLLAFAVGMLTLRAYPYPLRLIGRLTARRRSAVPFLGVSRAARQGIVAALPVIVLLLATAVAGFAAAVDAGLRRAQDSAAWLATGADARVTGIDLDAAAGGRIRQVPGVQGVVPAQYVDSATLGVALSSVNVTLVAVDLTAYRQLVAGTPIEVPRPSPDGPGVPALLSPELAQRVGSGPLNAASGVTPEVTVRPAGTVDVFPGATGDFVIVPYRALGAAAKPNTFFVHGDHLDPDRLRRAAGGNAVVTTQAAAHERLTGTPMIDLVRTAFRFGTLVVVGYATLAILLALILGSGARGQVVTYLRALGLSRAQARRLAIVELAPVLLCAAVAGWVAGVLLPHLLGPAVDLRPYTGGFRVTDYTPDPLPTIAVAAGLIAFGGIAIIIDTMVGTRRQLGPELRKEAQR
jgi:hypothetical protein